MHHPSIPGYSHGDPSLPPAPIDSAAFEEMKRTVGFGEEDVRWLKKSREILEPQVEAILDVWYGFVGSQPHLLAAFVDQKTKEPDGAYLAAVRKRFGQWILDTAGANWDRAWLDYQFEIGRRHHRVKKNRTDGASAAEHIPFRHLILLTGPVVSTLPPFLAKGGHSSEDVAKMQSAWLKAVLLQVTLWSYPYVKDGDF